MSDDILSQDEVESLLSSLEAGGPEAIQAMADANPPPATAARAGEVVPYDFKRPERVGKEQMRALQTLHESFGRNFGASLSALLRTIVEVKLTSVDQLTYSEFVFSLENPTCFNLLRAEPLDGKLVLDINPSILFPIIDRLLGGAADGGSVTRRPLTEVELRLVKQITDLFLEEMAKGWSRIVELDLEVERVESNPQLVHIVPPNEVVVLVSFELSMGELRGMMNLCIPFTAIERYSHALTANSWFHYAKVAATPETRATIGKRLQGATVHLHVTLAETTIPTQELLQLRVGDLIATECDVRDPAVVMVEGVPRFHARPGSFKGHKAIEIVRAVASPDQDAAS